MKQILLINLSEEIIEELQQPVLAIWPDAVFAYETASFNENTKLIFIGDFAENTLRQIKETDVFNQVPVVIISGMISPELNQIHDSFLPFAILTLPIIAIQLKSVLKSVESTLEGLYRKGGKSEIKNEIKGGGREILDSMMEGCQIIGFDWRYKYVNKAAELQNRRPATDLIGNRFMDVWPDIEKNDLFVKIKNALEKREKDLMNVNFEFPDGSSGYFVLKFQPIPEGVLITSFDITEQKATEKKLFESDKRWQFALEGADHGVWDWNLSTNKVEFTAQWKRLLDYEPQEIENDLKEWETRVHPEDLARAIKDIENHTSGETEFYESEYRMRKKDGTWVWILDKGKIFERDTAGNPLRMVGTHTDITKQKELETELKESQRNLLESQKVAGIGSYTLDFRTGIWMSSEVLDTIFGIDKEYERTVEGWGKIIHPDWQTEMIDYLAKKVALAKENFDKVYKIRRFNDKAERWVHGLGRLEFDIEGKPLYMIGTIQDVTDRKEADDEVNKSRQILKLFVEFAPAAIAMFDTEMRYMAVSNRFIADYHLSEINIIGKSHYEIFPDMPQRWKDVHKECMRGAVRIQEEDSYLNSEGKTEWIKWEVRPWFENDKEVGGVLLFTELITNHKNMIKALEESEERFRLIVESAPVGIAINDFEGNIIFVNKFLIELTGYVIDDIPTTEIWMNFAYPDPVLRAKVGEKWKNVIGTAAKGEKVPTIEYPVYCKNGTIKQIEFRPAISNGLIYIIITDLTEKHAAREELRRIEWMLSKKIVDKSERNPADLPYGDLTALNENGLILHSVGKEVLGDIVNDYLSLLETSSAIYEKNGDYAFGIFSSGWCRFLDEASRNLCNTDDNRVAMASGKWHCHESCWKNASLKAMEENAPVDVECAGGINLFALPIFAANEIIGTINFGYGNPPTDQQKLIDLAEKYGVAINELEKQAAKYETRPPYIIDSARERLHASASLIGEIVTRKISEQKVIELNESLEKTVAEKTSELKERISELERLHEATIDREFRIKELRDEIEFLKKANN